MSKYNMTTNLISSKHNIPHIPMDPDPLLTKIIMVTYYSIFYTWSFLNHLIYLKNVIIVNLTQIPFKTRALLAITLPRLGLYYTTLLGPMLYRGNKN